MASRQCILCSAGTSEFNWNAFDWRSRDGSKMRRLLRPARSREHAMIAYLILVHRYPEQFKRMFRAIYVPGNQYVVHVDKRSGRALRADIAAFIAPYQGAELLDARKVQWGGY